jgi:hypothetical protein
LHSGGNQRDKAREKTQKKLQEQAKGNKKGGTTLAREKETTAEVRWSLVQTVD